MKVKEEKEKQSRGGPVCWLGTKEEEVDFYRLAKQRDKHENDVQQVRVNKDRNRNIEEEPEGDGKMEGEL